jgi:hypothetical protein
MEPWTYYDRVKAAFRSHKTEMLIAAGIGAVIGAILF